MFTKRELIDAIEKLETSPGTYQDCEKLATFYTIYDHFYGEKKLRLQTEKITTIPRYGDAEFYQAIDGANAEAVFKVVYDLMVTTQALQPRVYQAVIDQLRAL